MVFIQFFFNCTIDFYVYLCYYIVIQIEYISVLYPELPILSVTLLFFQAKGWDTMKITYTAKNVTLRDNFKERVEKKLKKYERVFSENAEVKVTVNLYKNRQTVEITIKDNGMVYRVESSCPEMNDALDTNMDKLGRQIRKNKTKLEKRLRPAALEVFEEQDIGDDTDDIPEEVTYNIFRTKTVPLKPMSPDEAILRMNMVNHKFFMFLNSKTDKICVVYIRDNGDYGMLESEITE